MLAPVVQQKLLIQYNFQLLNIFESRILTRGGIQHYRVAYRRHYVMADTIEEVSYLQGISPLTGYNYISKELPLCYWYHMLTDALQLCCVIYTFSTRENYTDHIIASVYMG